jgi:hypothetical protein
MELRIELKIGSTKHLDEGELLRTMNQGGLDGIKQAFKALMVGEFQQALRNQKLILLFEREFESQWEKMIHANFPEQARQSPDLLSESLQSSRPVRDG